MCNEQYESGIVPLKEIWTLETLKSKGVRFLNKFLVIDAECKLNIIKQSKLWASFPENFNDILDTQIRLNDKQIKELGHEFYKSHTFKCSDLIVKILKFKIELLRSTHISCFTECDPVSIMSAHMWGLYANNGKGIVLQYDIGELIKFMKCCSDVNSSDFYNVAYDLNSNQLLRLNKYKILKCILEKSNYSEFHESQDVMTTLLSVKSQQWQYEKEWRFISLKAWPYDSEHYQELKNYASNPQQHKSPMNINREEKESLKLQKYREETTNCEFKFIKPSIIVFGCDCDMESGSYYNQLYSWAINNRVECKSLDSRSIDYNKGSYNFIALTA